MEKKGWFRGFLSALTETWTEFIISLEREGGHIMVLLFLVIFFAVWSRFYAPAEKWMEGLLTTLAYAMRGAVRDGKQ